jgi:hypothetical protein
MSDPVPAAIPWYRSSVLQGLMVLVFTQLIAKLASHFHIDIAELTSLGINADALTQWTLDGISALAVAYATHGRLVKPLPEITSSQPKADVINAATPPPTQEPKP